MIVCVGGIRVRRVARAILGVSLTASLFAFGADALAAGGRAYVPGTGEQTSPALVYPARPRNAFAHYRPSASDPPFSAIVVDANNGRELYGVDENALRHPASLTKVMTLYLLFDELQKGAMTLDTPIRISEHAAAQEPSKLGIPAGDSLTADQAIKAIVTRSANDVAVAIAETIGHDESTFAEMMTRKAHALGMSRTLYRNASGLPNDEQLTTARDLSILARATEDHFPQYFHYFSTHEFDWDGEVIGNHDHLIGRVDGVDGMKTGYTRASGFNLLTTLHSDGRSVVAVVLGGRTSGQRDRIMAAMLDDHVAEASDRGHTAPMIADNESPVAAPPSRPAVAAVAPPPRPAVAAVAAPPPRHVVMAENDAEGDDSDSDDAPTPKLAPARPAAEAPSVLAVADTHPAAKPVDDPAALGWVKGPEGKPLEAARAKGKGKDETRVARDDAPEPRSAHSGWIIQIGASDDAVKAAELLSRARAQTRGPLAAAKPFTEKFVKDGGTFYRARFAGLDQSGAESACKSLRRNGFPCFAAHLD
ncbi:MAG: serine hydrolase [Roseiarcus sp.]